MTDRTLGRLSWPLWFASVLLTAAGLAFYAFDHLADQGTQALLAPPLLAFATVGAIVDSRRPANPIGWIFSVVGLLIAVQLFSFEYADRGLVRAPGSLPAATVFAWLQTWIWTPALGLAGTLLLLLFPEGRLVSQRWRPVAWAGFAATALAAASRALRPGGLENFPAAENPVGLGRPGGGLDAIAGAHAGELLIFLVVLASIASLAVRYCRAGWVEREQLKWFLCATAALGAANVVVAATNGGAVGWGLWLAAMIAMPVATGVAILRYRLYAIDRIINRTLVYGALSALLGGLYFGIVIALEQAFSPVTQGSELAVTGSTLAVAALFRPVRRRIQTFVDRRFYRRKVNAERTLGAFTDRLRREIDLDTLTAELQTAAQETMQPAHVSLWVRAQEAEQ